MSTPAGWYDDGSGRQRWWDGTRWTDNVADQTAAPGPLSAVADATNPVPDVPAMAPVAPAAPAIAADAPAPAGRSGNKPHVLAWIALAAAVIGFIFACIKGALIIGWILLPIAFVLAIVALFLNGKKWPAIVALIVSIVGTIVGVVVFFSVVADAANDAFGGGTPAIAQPSMGETATAGGSTDQPANGKYAVTIGDSHLTSDYEGKPVLVVNFTFTNNSDRDVSFLFATSAKAFQNGVELETAIVTEDAQFDVQSSMKDVKPGSSLQVQEAYVLSDKSDVTVEVKPLISLSDRMLATKTIKVQ